MKKKQSKQKNISPNTFPFTKLQLEKLKEELEEAGGFDQLMVIKKALTRKSATEYEVQYHDDVEAYKEKFLNGEYESLKDFYDTEIPYSFWSTFYETLRRVENRNE